MNNTDSAQLMTKRQATIAIVCIMLLGAFLRLNHLFGQRPFWYDELILLFNLMDRTFLELREPLSEYLVAPFGFMVVIKWFGETLGFTELGVRLPVTIASLASLAVFVVVACRISDRVTASVASLLFASNTWLIYYAAEMKQYSFDVLASLLIYCCSLPLLRAWKTETFIALAAIGMVAVWFSHPAAFVLGGVGVVLIWQSIAERNYSRAVAVGAVSALWIASFVLQIWFTSGLDTEAVENQRSLYWLDNFMPFPPASVAEVMWLWTAFIDLFEHPLGFETAGLAALTAVAGAWAMWRRSAASVMMLLLPILITLLASAVHLYPFTGRLLLFVCPAILLLIAEGTVLFSAWAWSRSRLVGAIGLTLLLFHPLLAPLSHVGEQQPYLREGLPAVLAYVQEHAEPGDHIHLYFGARMSYRFYAPQYGLDKLSLTIVQPPQKIREASINDWPSYVGSLDEYICKPRVWLVFAHVSERDGIVDAEQLLIFAADRLGTQTQSTGPRSAIRADSMLGASAHLYNFVDGSCGTSSR